MSHDMRISSNIFYFSEIVEILSEKCNLNKDEVREKYESFQSNYPEGEITKEQFLETMRASELFSSI